MCHAPAAGLDADGIYHIGSVYQMDTLLETLETLI